MRLGRSDQTLRPLAYERGGVRPSSTRHPIGKTSRNINCFVRAVFARCRNFRGGVSNGK
jgi:hypothetical protein